MRRLVAYITEHQSTYGFAPKSYREIGAEIGTSHTQVRRLILKALEGGILRKTDAGGLAYEQILNPPTPTGVVWVPRVECFWRKPMHWERDPARGCWLDRSIYGLEDAAEDIWAVTFPEPSSDGREGYLRLDEQAMLLVRRCANRAFKRYYWYLLEYDGQVIVSSFRGDEFRQVRGKVDPLAVSVRRVTDAAEVMSVTARPPGSKPKG